MSETEPLPSLSVTVAEIEPQQPVSVSEVLIAQGKPSFTIGSHPRSHLQLIDPLIAQCHATISVKDGAYWVSKPFQQNEVFVNDHVIKRPTKLSAGDAISVGGYTLKLNYGAATRTVETNVESVPQVKMTRFSAVDPQVKTPEVYYPKKAEEPRSRFSVGTLLLLLIAAVAVVGGYTLINNGNNQAAAASNGLEQNNPFAYNDGNVTVLQFSAPDCTACVSQLSLIESVMNENRGNVYVSTADVYNPSNEYLLRRYAVQRIPTIVILNDQGEAIATAQGVVDEASLRTAVKQALDASTGSTGSATAQR